MRNELSRALDVQWVAALARPVLGMCIVFGGQLDHVTHADWAMVDAVTAALSAWGAARFARAASSSARRGAAIAVTCLAASAVCELATACSGGRDEAVCYLANLSGLAGVAINARVIRAELLAGCSRSRDGLAHGMSWTFTVIAAMYAISPGSEGWLILAVLSYAIALHVYVTMLILAGSTLRHAEPQVPRAVSRWRASCNAAHLARLLDDDFAGSLRA